MATATEVVLAAVTSNPSNIAGGIKSHPSYRGRGKANVLALVEELATGQRSDAATWGSVLGALKNEGIPVVPSRGIPVVPPQQVAPPAPVPQSVAANVAPPPAPPAQPKKGKGKKGGKSKKGAQNVNAAGSTLEARKAAYHACKTLPKGDAFKQAYNAYLVQLGMQPYYL